ncbi:MAG: excisionase family DNA-binding protein [Phycisphaerales bacterium]
MALSPAEAAAALGIGRRTLDALLADDAIPNTRIGARVLIPVAELQAWLSARTAGGGAEGGAA